MIVAGSLLINSDPTHQPKKHEFIGRLFDYGIGKVIATKIPLPLIYTEIIEFLVDCIVLSALYAPASGIRRVLQPDFRLSLPLINFCKKHEFEKTFWLEIITLLANYCFHLDKHYIISKQIENIDESKKVAGFILNEFMIILLVLLPPPQEKSISF